jgi:3-deoxy-D-manno-octulosonic-acid transferase
MLFFDLLYIIVLLVSLPFWGFKVFFKKEYRRILIHRLSPPVSPPKDGQKRVWLHAVSVGEVRSLRHLIRKLKQAFEGKHTDIILSVTTPSGYQCALEEYPDITVINAPVDFSFVIRRFIKKIKPQLLVLNELEIWPNWVTVTNRKKIPILLINGRMSQRAFKRYRLFRFFLKPFFSKIYRYLLQAEVYRERFQAVGIPPECIRICGNIKADEAYNSIEQLPLNQQILDHLKIGPANKKVITIASSHAGDEQLVAPIFNYWKEDYFFIIVPRHLERLESIEQLLKANQVDYDVWSRLPAGGRTAKTLIFDQMGYLFEVLKISHAVFMGGTLDPAIGGHNLYEPTALGLPVIGGPHFNNFPDIGEELVAGGVYTVVNDARQCSQALAALKNSGADLKRTGQRAIDIVARRTGSMQCTLEEICRLSNC